MRPAGATPSIEMRPIIHARRSGGGRCRTASGSVVSPIGWRDVPLHLHPSQLVAHEVVRHVGERVAEPEVGVMHLGLAPPSGRQDVARHVAERRLRRRAVPRRLLRPTLLQPPDRAADVGDQLAGEASGTGLDVGPPALDATLVLIEAIEHPDDAVGIAGDVGEHVSDGPVGQQRRLSLVEVPVCVELASRR